MKRLLLLAIVAGSLMTIAPATVAAQYVGFYAGPRYRTYYRPYYSNYSYGSPYYYSAPYSTYYGGGYYRPRPYYYNWSGGRPYFGFRPGLF